MSFTQYHSQQRAVQGKAIDTPIKMHPPKDLRTQVLRAYKDLNQARRGELVRAFSKMMKIFRCIVNKLSEINTTIRSSALVMIYSQLGDPVCLQSFL